ncbi:Yqey-like protein-domain-containing protein [Syncephalis pseudoplumigaleata]|uniref:Altered inheritance of mitochondria protein 41 n=1 Tax=Syncephalis pseudoplumigaleata TaxID=1712513 RepID=A0A4P9YZI1_9FUNG|nr:Yqey-like protein-domain-containing protein [Syncephalis pseudoplumigaleata]|eukprot:RKP25398.1 Yqey-like protein-domain-containing protein [Syncephalis pseudoplumigaleata]
MYLARSLAAYRAVGQAALLARSFTATSGVHGQEDKQPRNGGLLAQIRDDMKQAMRAKDKPRATLLKSVITEVTYAEKKATSEQAAAAALDDAGVMAAIQRSIKKRQEAIDAYGKAQREDLAAKEREERNMLASYLPVQLTPEEIDAEARRAVAEVGATSVKDMGEVMRAIRIAPGCASKQAIATAVRTAITQASST